MTAEEFERQYAERSGTTVEQLRKMGRIVAPCDCGEEMCEGWQSTTAQRLEDERQCKAMDFEDDEEDDEDLDDEPLEDPKMGMCCICMEEHPSVRNLIMLDKRAEQEGIGCWGCLQCGLPMAGAVAVLCDDCLVEYQEDRVKIGLACVGEPGDNKRVPLVALTETFEHDMSKHPGEA